MKCFPDCLRTYDYHRMNNQSCSTVILQSGIHILILMVIYKLILLIMKGGRGSSCVCVCLGGMKMDRLVHYGKSTGSCLSLVFLARLSFCVFPISAFLRSYVLPLSTLIDLYM